MNNAGDWWIRRTEVNINTRNLYNLLLLLLALSVHVQEGHPASWGLDPSTVYWHALHQAETE